MKKSVLLLIVTLSLTLSSCFKSSSEYKVTSLSEENKSSFYEHGKDLILKGNKLDMKYEFMDTSDALNSRFGIYFKNETFEEVSGLKIKLETNNKKGEKGIEVFSSEEVDIYKWCNFPVDASPERYLQFDLGNILSWIKPISDEELREIEIDPHKIEFEFSFKNKRENFNFSITNEQMFKFQFVEINEPLIDIFNNFNESEIYGRDIEFQKVFENCYISYLYDKEFWRKILNETYDAILTSNQEKEILLQEKPLSIYYPFWENEKRTKEDCIFVYNSMKRLYKGKDYIRKEAKEEIVKYFEKVNERLNFVSQKEMNRLMNLDWDNEINDFDELIFGFELGN